MNGKLVLTIVILAAILIIDVLWEVLKIVVRRKNTDYNERTTRRK